MLTKMHIKKKNIVFDFWGTLAKLEDGPDFGEKISKALGISKKEYLCYVQENWFTECFMATKPGVLFIHFKLLFIRHFLDHTTQANEAFNQNRSNTHLDHNFTINVYLSYTLLPSRSIM